MHNTWQRHYISGHTLYLLLTMARDCCKSVPQDMAYDYVSAILSLTRRRCWLTKCVMDIIPPRVDSVRKERPCEDLLEVIRRELKRTTAWIAFDDTRNLRSAFHFRKWSKWILRHISIGRNYCRNKVPVVQDILHKRVRINVCCGESFAGIHTQQVLH